MANYLDKSGLLRVLRGVQNQIERNVGELKATKGRPNGIASLDGKGFVPLAQLGNLDMNFFEAVQELPTKDIKKHIYLIKNTKEGKQDTYDEFIYTGDVDGEYDSTKWEKLGDFVPTFDLKEYAKKKDAVNSISIRDIGNSSDAPDNFELGLYYINGDGEEKCVTIPTVTVGGVSTHPSGALRPYTGHNGLMTSEDKAKLDKIDTEALSQSITAANTAAGNTNEAIRKCETATTGAEKVNANLTDDNVVEITDRTGTTKSVSLDEAVKVGNDVTRIKQTLGAYSDREDVVLTPKETNKAISSDGVKVAKQGWAIAEFTAEKGNEYLFKPNVIDGSVCVFAEYITSIETRGIDYTYTYNEDGTIATATATYLGNTHTYTYEWTVEAGVNTPTIKEGDTVINNLPMTYETKVGTYSPLVKLNEDAELPVDGYCRYMSHFKGNSSIKIVVSYKVGTADLTMKVLRDGVLASISTQLGNLSQKEDETRKKVEEYHGSYAEFMFNDDTRIIVDGKNIIIAARVKTRVYPKKSLVVGDRYSQKTLIYADVANLDTSGFTTFNAMFANCNILSELNLSAWDTSQVTSMASMFSGCSSLTSLNLSAWDTTSLGKGEKESVSETGIYMMFYGSYNIKTLDMGGDGWNFVNIPSSNSFYRPLESRALTEWKLGKNFFKGRFANQYYDNNAFNNWSKSSFIESIVTNSYDRRANGYDDVTLYFAAKLKDYLSEDDIATMTAKGYIIA